eukprot:4767663-Pyramimonas_sp.AAC.1
MRELLKEHTALEIVDLRDNRDTKVPAEDALLIVTTLSQHYHNIVTTLSQHCHNIITTLSQHCHNIITTLSQHAS